MKNVYYCTVEAEHYHHHIGDYGFVWLNGSRVGPRSVKWTNNQTDGNEQIITVAHVALNAENALGFVDEFSGALACKFSDPQVPANCKQWGRVINHTYLMPLYTNFTGQLLNVLWILRFGNFNIATEILDNSSLTIMTPI